MLESKTVWCVLLTANNSFWKRSVLNSMWLKCTLPYILRDVGNPDQFKTGEGRPKAQKCWCLKRILRNIDVSWHFFLYCLPIALHCVECFMSCYLNKTVFNFWDCIGISWQFFTLPTHLQIFMLIFQKMVDTLHWPPLPRDVGAMRSWWWSCGGKRRHWCFGHSWTPACQPLPPHITGARVFIQWIRTKTKTMTNLAYIPGRQHSLRY